MRKEFLELIRRASCTLPEDVIRALRRGVSSEADGSTAKMALEDVVKNCRLATESSRPICQDTGTNIWYVYHPQRISTLFLKKEILAATKEATKKSYLRPNAVDPISGKFSADNTGPGAPVIHFHEWKKKAVVADIMLKGGGCENVSCQYSLPDPSAAASRDIDGVRKVVIDGVWRAQGRGCGPGIVGVGIGGDRASGMIEAKRQLFRLLDDKNPDPVLAKLEARLLSECNELAIGPMGFGGKTTVLAVKVGKELRLPASYFVSIAYMCWACRRASVTIEGKKARYSERCESVREYKAPSLSRSK